MKFLAIDTSGGAVCVAAVNGEKQAVRAVEGTTSVRLMEEIDAVLRDAETAARDLDFIACAVGPGSFTGIRIGISTAKGLCFALDKKALAITSFETIAYAESERVLAVIDAGHGNYYVCPFENGVRGEPAFCAESELLRYRNEGYRLLSSKPLAVDSEISDIRSGLVEAAKKNARFASDAARLAALYLRKSSAEEKR